MKKPGRTSPSRRGHLSEADEELWEATAGTVRPLRRAKSRVHAAVESLDEQVVAPRSKKREKHETEHRPQKSVAPVRPAASTRVAIPPLAEFDVKAARRIRSGRVDIEKRIDLHGMRQSEAHAALRHFLTASHARGLRMVLVITGKGAPSRRGGEDEGHGARFGEQERGVLKRNVPRWLAEPELRSIVVSYTTAAIQHGGEGALYVHLRRPDRI